MCVCVCEREREREREERGEYCYIMLKSTLLFPHFPSQYSFHPDYWVTLHTGAISYIVEGYNERRC